MATVASRAAEPWARLAELNRRAGHDRDGALRTLRELFASGSPSAGLDGVAEGRFLAFAVHPALDRAAAAALNRWSPWAGKRFDAAAARGQNLLFGGRLAAFGFTTRVEPGALDPRQAVLLIDYAAVPSNRWVGLSRVRDELVELAPGVHLGQALWRGGQGRHTRIAWWALRTG